MAHWFKGIIGSVIFLLLSIETSAQENCVHQFEASASVCIRNSEWRKALNHYELYAEHGGVFDAFHHLGQARAHLALGDTTACCSSLSKGIEYGLQWSGENKFLSISHALADEVASWLTKERINYDQLHETYLGRLDQALIQKIAGMAQRDQEVRLTGRNELSEKDYMEQIHSTDSIHLKEVKLVFDRFNGFPPDSLMERRTKFELMLLIQHFTRGFPKTFNYFAGVVQQAISRFQLHPGEYAAMADRRQYDIDGKSIYGEVPYRNEARELVVDNIQNIDQVDSLRFSIGLLSLKQHSIDRGFKLPTNYIEQRSPCLLD